ncbi:sarcoplasmic calcium-binding protein-like [Lingula anatina]|uniref:Sarcoplasmic calcium-binding protein-like n=1 Tax=Lingula anatina TaxID=7574 RepID=A0A1S3ISX4_LINAN|nr:sarcoplasmic calcium-binding protein-like [Lingula anatina]|eukprot:XP_013401302.1 sarcoplasmic calcium-binding protein-like [Lingula anatina]
MSRLLRITQLRPHLRLVQPFSTEAERLHELPFKYPEVKGSPIWMEKMRTWFFRQDVDRDGYLSKGDFEQQARRITEFMKLNDEQAKKLMDNRMHIWKYYVSGDPDNSDTVKIPDVEGKRRFLLAVNSTLRQSFFETFSIHFDGIDLNNDGEISQEEHAAFFYGYNIPTEFSPEVFKTLDTNNDGHVSREQFLTAYLDFIFSEDPDSKHVHFCGPLLK